MVIFFSIHQSSLILSLEETAFPAVPQTILMKMWPHRKPSNQKNLEKENNGLYLLVKMKNFDNLMHTTYLIRKKNMTE
jgi:hypothetical protein